MTEPLDILLLNIGGTRKRVYQELSKDYSAVDPPFWAALTAGFLRQHNVRVGILDANLENLPVQETSSAVLSRSPGLLAIVVYSQQANTCAPIMDTVGELCRELKRLDFRRPIILTGWQPSAIPGRTMREEVCDYLAEGEGFYTLLDLVRGRKLRDIPGLWWRNGDGIVANPRSGNVENLSEELSDVAWDLLPLNSGGYRAYNWMCLHDLESRPLFATMLTSLGCPFQCTFCAIHSVFGDRRVRYWSPDWVLKQMGILYDDFGVRNININDEQFVFNKNHFLPIARGILERGYKLNIAAFARVDVVHDLPVEDLHLLKSAGFNWFKLGIESGTRRCLKNVRKGRYSKRHIRQTIKKIHSAGINLCANYMFGLPGDTWDSMQDTLNFAFELNAAFPSFFCTMAVPGSDLYREAREKGIPLPDRWAGYAAQGYEFLPLPTRTLSSADVVAFRDYAFQAYFTNPRYLHSIERKFGRAAREHIQGMTEIRLKRKVLGD